MDFFEVLQKRRSIRKFSSKPVSEELIKKIIWAATLAPSARNIQPWEFLVIRDKNTKEKIAHLASGNGPFISDAPVCIAVFSKETKYYLEDCSAATTQALLCATSLGLGACWVAGDKKDYCKEIGSLLGLPEEFKLVSLIALGFSDEIPSTEKKNALNLIHWDRF